MWHFNVPLAVWNIEIIAAKGNEAYYKQRLLFLAAKGWIKSACIRKHIKEIGLHTNGSRIAQAVVSLANAK